MESGCISNFFTPRTINSCIGYLFNYPVYFIGYLTMLKVHVLILQVALKYRDDNMDFAFLFLNECPQKEGVLKMEGP